MITHGVAGAVRALTRPGPYLDGHAVRHLCLLAQNGTLRFTVSGDETGYDARHTPMGSGQRNMADRLAALGGRLKVRSGPQPVPSG